MDGVDVEAVAVHILEPDVEAPMLEVAMISIGTGNFFRTASTVESFSTLLFASKSYLLIALSIINRWENTIIHVRLIEMLILRGAF